MSGACWSWLRMTLTASALPHHWEQRAIAALFYVKFARTEASGHSIRLVPAAQHDLW